MPSGMLTVEEVMAILPETPSRIAALTEGMTPAQLLAAPELGSWSVNDVLAHLRACYDVLGGSMLRVLAEDHPTWKGMNPRAWINKTDYPDWEFQPAFEAFARQRADLLAVLEPVPPEDWERTATVIGMLGETYERSALYYGDWMAGHERAHLRNSHASSPRCRGRHEQRDHSTRSDWKVPWPRASVPRRARAMRRGSRVQFARRSPSAG